jgi:hypothetical protein
MGQGQSGSKKFQMTSINRRPHRLEARAASIALLIADTPAAGPSL